jgi:hypothetical protein
MNQNSTHTNAPDGSAAAGIVAPVIYGDDTHWESMCDPDYADGREEVETGKEDI